MISNNKKIYYITIISLLSSLSAILFLIGGLPIFVMFPYLKVDLSDIPAFIGGIIVSPGVGLLIELIKNSIHILQTHTLGIGELMSLIIGSTIIISYCFTFRWLIKKYRLQVSMWISYIFCLLITVVVALICNSIIYPLFLLSISSIEITKGFMITYLIAVAAVNFIKVTITVWVSLSIIKFSKLEMILLKEK